MGERSANLGSADRGAVAAAFAKLEEPNQGSAVSQDGRRTETESVVGVVAVVAAEKRGEKEKRTFLADFE